MRIQAKNVIAQQLKSTMFHNAPIQLAVQATGLSSRGHGFKSRWEHQISPPRESRHTGNVALPCRCNRFATPKPVEGTPAVLPGLHVAAPDKRNVLMALMG